MSNIKTIKKGEYLFKEGEKIQNVHLVQSGGFSITLTRQNKKNIEFFTVGTGQILGDTGLNAEKPVYLYNALATSEAKVLEISLDSFKQSIESSAQPLKILVKTLLERNKSSFNEIKSYKNDKDSSPCPDDQVAKIFGVIFHTANHKGKRPELKPQQYIMGASKEEINPNRVTVDWLTMRQYSQRIFGEFAKRLESAISILIKLKMADWEMGQSPDDPEGPDQIQKVHFYDLAAVEDFFEFYQYQYFKNGKSEVLKVDESCSIILNELLAQGADLAPDRFGVMTLDFQKTVEKFKEDLGINLTNDHFTRLENKGLFVKRAQRSDNSIVIQFDWKEFAMTKKIWRIIREIDKWNEKGYVDIHEQESKPKKVLSNVNSPCPECKADLAATAKFCSECGFKVAA